LSRAGCGQAGTSIEAWVLKRVQDDSVIHFFSILLALDLISESVVAFMAAESKTTHKEIERAFAKQVCQPQPAVDAAAHMSQFEASCLAMEQLFARYA
jgi:hypothetical protein